MEFVFDVALARDAIAYIFDIAPAKAQDGSPLGVKVTADENEVVFSVNGIDLFAKSGVVADVKTTGEAIVSLMALYKAIVGFSPMKEGVGTERLKIRAGGQNLTITAKTVYKTKTVNQRRSLALLDTQVANLQIISEDRFMPLPIELLSKGIRSVLMSSSSLGDGTGFAGMLIEVNEDRLKMAGMNGVSLTEFSSELPDIVESTSCVLESSYIGRVNKLLSKLPTDEDVDVLITDRMFLVKYDRLLVGMSVMATDFPNYASVLDVKRRSVVLDSEMFMDNLRNVMFSSDKGDDFRVTINFHDGELTIKTATCENEGIPVISGAENSIHVDFNIYLLESCIRNLGASEFSFSYKDRYSPIVFVPQDEGLEYELLTIVAPLK